MIFCFLTSGHFPFDERIFYHMALTLAGKNHSVTIITSNAELDEVFDFVHLKCFDGKHYSKKKKIRKFVELTSELCPDILICSEPLPLYSARIFRKNHNRKAKIFYDITEWYPSSKNLSPYNLCIKWYHFFRLFIFNSFISNSADAFIFGEYYKSLPYRIFFPWKPYSFVSYFPDLKYIPENPQSLKTDQIILSWSGKINRNKGFLNYIKVIKELSHRRPCLKISVHIIGWPDPDSKEKMPEIVSDMKNVVVESSGRLPFKDYLQKIRETDIFLDLRETTIENNHCLPIKLFYYAALGRPVIFSKLKSISKEFDISSFGFSVNPRETEQIVNYIIYYLENPHLYAEHCRNARDIITRNYNWKLIENRFVKFVTTI